MAPSLERISPSISKMAYGNFARETIGYYTFSIGIILMFFFISFGKKHRKHLAVKLKKPNLSGTIGFPERGDLFGNLV